MLGRIGLRVIAAMVSAGIGGCASDGMMSGEGGGEPNAGDLRPVAIVAEQNRSYDEAAKLYSALLAADPGNRGHLLNLARNLRFSGKTPVAISALTQPGVPTDDPMILLELGKNYLAADQLNLARPVLERAKAAAPLNWEVPSTLGVVLDYLNENDLAQAEYATALNLSPDNPTILNNLALSLAQQGKLDQAILTLQRAIDQQSAPAQSRQNLALLLALKGEPDEAERLVRKDLPADMAENNITYYRSFAIGPAQ